MNKRSFISGLAILAVLAGGCSTPHSSMPVGEEYMLSKASFSFDKEQATGDLFEKYLIAPGDMLDVLFQIRTWVKKEKFDLAVDHTVDVRFVHAPELNQSQLVRPDGTISLPYVGNISVVGKSVEGLTEELREKYGTVLKNPELYVVVPQFRSAIKELKADLHTAPRGLSRLVTVRPDGYVTFPMVGDVMVADRSIPEVNEELNDIYEEVLPGLHCDLFLEKHSGSTIYVTGMVEKPGAYTITKPITVLEALAMAEGHIYGSAMDSVIIVRKHEGNLYATRLDMKKSLSFKENSEFFYLRPDDIVFVPKTSLATTAEVARDIASILFFRGWGISLEPRDFE
ncbi:polysaccharide biosynthesis/export family protein [Candidatus Moduliflexota bacterium]